VPRMTARKRASAPSGPQFDASQYVRAPVLNIASAIALGEALLARRRKDRDATAAEKKAARQLKRATAAAQEVWTERQRIESALPRLSGEQKRALDASTDQGWGALRMNLESHALLPAERSKKSGPAKELLHLLFKDGLGFLTWPHAEQQVAMGLLLKRIDEEGLAARIDAVCGPELLANIRANQALYTAMVQAGSGPGSDVSLGEMTRGISDAVVDYAVSVCATVDRKDPDTVKEARELLRPIDELREQQLARASAEAPKPPVPPAPAP
jgi:hypothetical protein